MLHNGLYEQVINKGLDTELASTDKLSQTASIDTAEASKVLAKYVAEVAERGLENLKDNGGDLNAQVAFANQIITTIKSETKEADFDVDLHEAVAQLPAPTPELKGKVMDCTQTGYKLNEKVIRHAQVVVGV